MTPISPTVDGFFLEKADRMRIGRWHSKDYEQYTRERVHDEDKFVYTPCTTLTGHHPIIFDGAIADGGRRETFFPEHYTIPEIRVDILHNVIVSGVGALFTETGEALCGMMPVGGAEHQFFHPAVELDLVPDQDGYTSPRLQGEPEPIDSAILFSRMGFGNYHHLLIDVLPRLHLLRHPAVKDFIERRVGGLPPLLVNIEFSGWLIDKYADCGGDQNELVHMPARGSVLVKKLVVPHLLNDFATWVSPEMHKFYDGVKQRLGVGESPFGDKVFLLRREFQSDRRRISNNVEIADLLISQGFREVFPEQLSWKEEMAVFSGASMIVAAMGSNISNMIFARPKTKVLILQSNRSVFSLHSAIGAAGGNPTGFLWGESFSHPSRGEHVEFVIDSDLMKQGLSALYAA